MGRGIVYSFALHAGIVLILLTAASFGTKQKINFDEVIKVSLASLPAKPEPAPIAQPKPAEPKQAAPVEPPKPTAKKVVTEKPKPKEKKQTKPAAKNTKQNENASENKDTTPTEATGADTPFKGATVDNAAFKYDWWFSQAFYKIQTNFRNTVAYDGKLVCTISFRVLKSGRTFDLKVLESSGVQEFDDVCVSAIELSSPFPPLPRDYAEEDVGITVPLSYDPASQ
jgi:TonB family protein